MTIPIYNPSGSQQLDNPVKLFLAATDFSAFGTATLTRTSKGIYYWSCPASGTVQLVASLKAYLRNLQKSTIEYTKAGNIYGALALKSVTADYLISTANATSGSVTISATTYPADNTVTAPTVIDLMASKALSTGFRANLYQTVLTPTAAEQNTLPINTDEVTAEVIIVTPASSVVRFYGLALNLNYTSN